MFDILSKMFHHEMMGDLEGDLVDALIDDIFRNHFRWVFASPLVWLPQSQWKLIIYDTFMNRFSEVGPTLLVVAAPQANSGVLRCDLCQVAGAHWQAERMSGELHFHIQKRVGDLSALIFLRQPDRRKRSRTSWTPTRLMVEPWWNTMVDPARLEAFPSRTNVRGAQTSLSLRTPPRLSHDKLEGAALPWPIGYWVQYL